MLGNAASRLITDVSEAPKVSFEAAAVGQPCLDEAFELVRSDGDLAVADESTKERGSLPGPVAIDLGDSGSKTLT